MMTAFFTPICATSFIWPACPKAHKTKILNQKNGLNGTRKIFEDGKYFLQLYSPNVAPAHWNTANFPVTRSFDTSCSPTKFTQFLRSFPQRLEQKRHCEQSNAKQRLVVVMPLFKSSMLRTFTPIVSAHPYCTRNSHSTSCIERAR